MKTLFLLRHGETTWNQKRRVMGRRETPLSRKGIHQARQIARILPSLEIEAIYTSPLKRAVQTTHILAERDDVSVKIDANLTEVAFGRWEGYRFEELIRDRSYRRFLKTPLKAKVPGGETIRDVQKRGLKVARRAAKEFPEGRLLFVSHGDVIRAIVCHYMRLPLEEFRRLRIDNGSLTALEVDGLWAELKFINYLPDITRSSKEPYVGLNPTHLRRGKTNPTFRRPFSKR
ncbi:MAG: histidine phosphatase family protein [Candidatus Binatia bacterium]